MTQEKRSSGFPTRSDTNRPVQSQKQARCLKFRIQEEKLHYPCSENKGADQLRSNTAKLICVFVFAKAKIWFSLDAAQMLASVKEVET